MRFMACLLVPVLLSIFAPGTAFSTTYVVRPDGTGDFPTIQAAIDAASDGDVIALADGTFQGDGNRDIDYLGKALTVRSQSGRRDQCTIDCQATAQSPHRGFYFHTGESLSSVLQGVTVAGGNPTLPEAWGGGILCEYASPTIVDCASIENPGRLGRRHALLGLERRSDRLLDRGEHGDHERRRHLLHGQLARRLHPDHDLREHGSPGSGRGHGLQRHGGGLWLLNGSAPVLENTIIAFGVEGEAILCWDSVAHLSCCDVFGNEGGDWIDCIEGQLGVEGNRAEDPLFCDPGAGDFTLHGGSPCGPSGDCGLIGAWPVSCDGTPVIRTSWGALKALYRE
jgi:hypothetical protein